MSGLRRRTRLLAAAAVASLLVSASSAFATTLVLRNGQKVEGEIVSRDEKEIRFKLTSGKVQTYKVTEVDHVEEPPPPPVVANETGDATVDARSKEYGRWLDMPLATTPGEFVVVRGDHPPADLKRLAEASDRTVRQFLQTFECKPADALRGDRYGPARIEIFQFLKEDGYLAYCDKVLARIRDELVDDKRLAFMRRQRGLWVVTPRAMLAQYQGPSDLVTSVSAAVHKTSHVLLHGWKPSGTYVPWWLYEGFATWQTFAILGETRTYCLDLARPADYSRPGTPEADEAAKARSEEGWRAKVKELVKGRCEKDLARLGKMSLNEIVLIDVQQSWSVVDWLHHTARLKQFVADLKDARDLDAACRTALGMPVAAAHDAWRGWVLRSY